MIRYSGLFCNRWKERYLSQARKALNKLQPFDIEEVDTPAWRERQIDYTGIEPLICPHGEQPLVFVGYFFGDGRKLQLIFEKAGCDSYIPEVLLRSG